MRYSNAKELIEEPEIILATLKIYSPPFDSVVASGLPLRTHMLKLSQEQY